MKKFDLVHTTILIVAILSGYASLQFLVSILSTIAYSFSPVNPIYSEINYFSIISNNFLMGVLDAIIAIVLIRNGRKYAGIILKDEADEETHQLGLDRQNIILALLGGHRGFPDLRSPQPRPIHRKEYHPAHRRPKNHRATGRANHTTPRVIIPPTNTTK